MENIIVGRIVRVAAKVLGLGEIDTVKNVKLYFLLFQRRYLYSSINRPVSSWNEISLRPYRERGLIYIHHKTVFFLIFNESL